MEQAAIAAKAMAEVSLHPGPPLSACNPLLAVACPATWCALPACHVAGYPSTGPKTVSRAETSGLWAPEPAV